MYTGDFPDQSYRKNTRRLHHLHGKVFVARYFAKQSATNTLDTATPGVNSTSFVYYDNDDRGLGT